MPKEILDQKKPLSQCMLWDLQTKWFEESGIAAWEICPFHATSNPFIAEVYAELILGYLLDSRAALHPDEPVYLVEIGAGTGRFSFHLLRELAAKKAHMQSLAPLKLVLVMTDVPVKNVEFWEGHEAFGVFKGMGTVDFAVFNPEKESEIHLRLSKKTLKEGAIKNPLILIANYVFDTLHQDLFRVDKGKLLETQVDVVRDVPELPASHQKNGRLPHLDDVRLEETHVEISGGYYEDEELDGVLAHYVETMDEASVLFPIGAFEVIRRFEALASGNLLVISSDKGFTHGAYMNGHFEHTLSHHGSFSYMVNYHALRRYFEQKGGTAFCTEDSSLFLHTGMFIQSPEGAGPFEMSRYFFHERLINKSTICDIYNLPNFIPSDTPITNKERIERALSLVRTANYDPVALRRAQAEFTDGWAALGEEAQTDGVVAAQMDELRESLLEMTDRARERFHLLNSNDKDELHAVGTLYYILEKYQPCVAVFEKSESLFGEDSYAHYYLASAAEMLDDYEESLRRYSRALEMDPDCPLTLAGVKRLKLRLRRV